MPVQCAAIVNVCLLEPLGQFLLTQHFSHVLTVALSYFINADLVIIIDVDGFEDFL